MRSGRTWRTSTLQPTIVAIDHVNIQPLQWNIGTTEYECEREGKLARGKRISNKDCALTDI